MTFTIAAFYKFVAVPDPAALQQRFGAAFTLDDLCGTMLIATEGVNGTMAGRPEVIHRLLTMLVDEVGLGRAAVKLSYSDTLPFQRLKFKVKRDILTFRNVAVDPNQPGTYVAPEDWNSLIADPEVLLLDTRNTYETEIGTFAGAVDPHLDTFSDFVTYVRENLDPERHRKIAMFCTGGIRCEKASAFLLQQGFPEVFHLQNGILGYLETVAPEASTWNGSCFVFDDRRAVSQEDLLRESR